MANIAQVLKEEISRLARKEVRLGLAKLQKDNAATKKNIAELKRQVAALTKENKQLCKQLGVAKKPVVEAPAEGEDVKIRATGKMIFKFRKRHKLSQAELAKLLGVTGQSIYQWERKEGKLRLRNETKARLANVRKMGIKQIREALAAE